MSDERARRLAELAERLGHRFREPALLDRALTHASRVNEAPAHEVGDNEPLEFLGDAVLQLCVTDLLHRRDPEGGEGGKTRCRARLVSAPSLTRRARALGLPQLLRLGKGEEKTGGRGKATLWANAYEAVVAALYLDGGLEAAQRFVAAEFAGELDAPPGDVEGDAKSRLQELLQGRGRPLPSYVVVDEAGPSHSPLFRVECRLDDGGVTTGTGSSKKAAEQQAAALALARLDARSAAGAREP